MIIADRLRELREGKSLSQGDIEKRTGLLRCYISRVENGHTVPAIETLEKLARALEVPLYQFFYVGGAPQKPPTSTKENTAARAPGGYECPPLFVPYFGFPLVGFLFLRVVPLVDFESS